MIRPALPLCVAAALATALLARASLADDAGEAADHLARARSFADCMIRHGRDRYGPVHSPLFANALTREDPPRLTPYPLFAPTPVNKKTGKPYPQKETGLQVFGLFDFNKVLNYPKGLGSEGPHKVTLFGCDPYEDRELYEFLFDLSRITGEPRYAAEARKALEWWFRHTQGPAGLYPWGEHLGWDFENECPTYFAGPSRRLYAACYHEIKDTVPFLDILAALPAEAPGKPTPLERYALGIWNAHFWDKDKAWYCRHGDYRGLDDRVGSLSGFPAHLGAYLRVWTAAWLASTDDEFRRRMETILHKALDMAISRSQKYGFYPFTFEADAGKGLKEKSASGQSIRLAGHAAELAGQLAKPLPEVAAKLRRLAELQIKKPWSQIAALSQPDSPAPPDNPPDLSKEKSPVRHARTILLYVEAYRSHGRREYLDAARSCARRAGAMFLDGASPLPRALPAGTALTTATGEFPDFYFRGAALMHALARLGEAMDHSSRK